MSFRQTQFKNQGKDVDSLRKMRADQVLSLRKEKRDDNQAKRRILPTEMQDDVVSMPLDEPIIMTVEEISYNIKSDDFDAKMSAVVQARKLLSLHRNAPVMDFVNNGTVKCLVECLKIPNPEMQFEATWSLTNIASGESVYTNAVAEAGAVPILVELLRHPTELRLREQIVWAIGNVVGDGPQLRDYCLEAGIVDPLLSLITPDAPVTTLRHVTWVMVNICRSKVPPPPCNVVEKLLPFFSAMMDNGDGDILIDCCWALAYATDGNDALIQLVINAGLVEKLVPLMGHVDPKVQMASLRAVGNIITGNDQQTQFVLDRGALQYVHDMLTRSKCRIIKDAIWFVSNIAAGTERQIQMLIDYGIVAEVARFMDGYDYSVQKEGAWALSNIASCGKTEHIFHLYECGVVATFANLMKIKDIYITQLALDGIHNMLKKGNERTDDIAQQVESSGALELIEELQNHECNEVYKMAYDIIENFFSSFDANLGDEQFEFAQPSAANSADFSFT